MLKRIARKIKNTLRPPVNADHIKVKVKKYPHIKKLGSDYGGWSIITDKLSPSSVIYSFGVGEDITFDLELINLTKSTVHAFDPTPRSIDWVKKQNTAKQFVMHDFGLSNIDGNLYFNPPENPNHISHTVLNRPETEAKAISLPVKKITTIMKELGHSHIDVLKMDIEGSEYDVIDDLFKNNIKPHQLLIEFHHRFPGVGVEKTKNAIKEITEKGYELFFVSEGQEDFCFILRA